MTRAATCSPRPPGRHRKRPDRLFARIVHADWSKHPGGRWSALAHRTPSGWRAHGPGLVGDVAAFVGRLVDSGRREPTLAAFDSPIGLPEAYGAGTGFAGFRAALDGFGGTGWDRLVRSRRRAGRSRAAAPVLSARPGAARVRHLLDGLGVATAADLMRRAERGGPGTPECRLPVLARRGQDVGKAAIPVGRRRSGRRSRAARRSGLSTATSRRSRPAADSCSPNPIPATPVARSVSP